MEGSVDTGKIAGAGAWDDDDLQIVGLAGNHGAGVHQGKAADSAAEFAGDSFDGDISTEAGLLVAGGEHFALGGGLEIAVDLFIDREGADGGLRIVSGRRDLDFEGAGGVIHSGRLSLNKSGGEREGSGKQEFAHSQSLGDPAQQVTVSRLRCEYN